MILFDLTCEINRNRSESHFQLTGSISNVLNVGKILGELCRRFDASKHQVVYIRVILNIKNICERIVVCVVL